MSPRRCILTWLCGALAAGCLGSEGTVAVRLVTAPGSELMAQVQKVRLTLSEPFTQVEAVRKNGGFTLRLSAPAGGEAGRLTVECLNDLDQLVGYGRSPEFTVGPIDASVALYVAPPMSMGASPAALATARYEVGSATLRYGAIIAGGRGNDNAARAELEIYNAFSHELERGLDLPAPRAGAAVGTALDDSAYVLGGAITGGGAQTNVWRFATTVAPAGAWFELAPLPSARAGERALPVSVSRLLVTGSAAVLDLASGVTTALSGGLAMPRDAVSIVAGGTATIIGVGARVVRFRDGTFDELSAAPALRTGHAVVSTADGQVAVVGGGIGGELSRDAVKIDPSSGAFAVVRDALEVPRKQAAVARAGRYIVVAGGVSDTGVILGSAEVLDATSLAHVATLPMAVPRTAAAAEPLPNDSVLVIGGIDSRGRATGALELFTPGPP